MAISWPTRGFKGRTFELWVLLNKWDLNLCVRSSPLRKWTIGTYLLRYASYAYYPNFLHPMYSIWHLPVHDPFPWSRVKPPIHPVIPSIYCRRHCLLLARFPPTASRPFQPQNPVSTVSFSACLSVAYRREAGDVWCLPPVWNLRAVIWFHFTISSLVFLPSPVTLSVLYFFLHSGPFSWIFSGKFFNIFR